MTMEQALRAIKQAVWVGIIIASLTSLFIVLHSMNIIDVNLNTNSLVHVVLVLILTTGIYYKRRASAVIFLIYFVAEKISELLTTGAGINVMSVLVLIGIIQGIRGTFAYHKLKSQGIETPIRSNRQRKSPNDISTQVKNA